MSDRAPNGAPDADTTAPHLDKVAIGLLMALGTLGQLAINIILPSLPAIARDMAVLPGAERLVISVFLIGFAGGQLLVGPLSDRFGRRRILIPGLIIYVLLGVAGMAAGTLEWLLAARLLQGLGAAAGFVVARAIARDIFDGEALVRIFGLLTLTMGIVPALAPVLGGLIQDAAGWHWNIAATVMYGAIVLALCFFKIPETGTPSETAFSPAQVAVGYVSILKERTFRRFAGTNMLTLGSLYAFHAGGPELMIEKLGLSASTFGMLAFMHSGAFMAGASVMTRFSSRIADPPRVMMRGALFMFAAALIMLGLGLMDRLTVVPTMVCMTAYGFGLGIVLPLGVAGALSPFKERAGAATAMLGAMQMSAGAAASAVVGAIGGRPSVVFPAVMIVMLFAALLNARRP